MAIYRPPKPRWPLILAGFLVGVLLGLLVALLLRSDPDPASVAADVATELSAAAGSLEVVEVEYEESVENGEIVKEAEYRGAVSALESSRERYLAVADALDVLAPERSTAIEDAYNEAQSQMSDRVDVGELSSTLSELEALLTGDSSD